MWMCVFPQIHLSSVGDDPNVPVISNSNMLTFLIDNIIFFYKWQIRQHIMNRTR